MIADTILDGVHKALGVVFGSRNERIIKSLIPTVERVNHFADEFDKLSDEALRAKTEEFKGRLKQGETMDELLPEAFGAVKSACRRLVGRTWLVAGQEKAWNDVPFDVQIMGGIVLHQGKIAEMVTGEGKTLVATMPAYLNALTGKSVHIVTVNDYLAGRDRDWMGPVYELLGMKAGALQSNIIDPALKREIYACDIVYGQNSEFGFDYLRDNTAWSLEGQCQKDLTYAIVDEVDSILIDEARTPHILSGPVTETVKEYAVADRIARRLKKKPQSAPEDVPDEDKQWDYEVKEKERNVVVTAQGLERIALLLNLKSADELQNDLRLSDIAHHKVRQALRAKELWQPDTHYIVQNDEVIIVDEFTGRLQPGRRWADGLHQAIEAKERIRVKQESETHGTITLQKYFLLYEKIAGMTGTAITEATEFWKIYKMDVVQVLTHKPLIRTSYPDVILLTAREKEEALAQEIEQVHAIGRPILVGTISIEKSEKLAELLATRGIDCEVLNAKQHQREAVIVAKAGEFGRVTIATNMAGRGTDIVLGRATTLEVLGHWKAQGLAPKDLSGRESWEGVEEKLVHFWAEKFLENGRNANRTPEELKGELEAYWEEVGQAPLRLSERVAGLGGLHIVGTERHEARRIDNQLRGRAGRQGDPGSSRFFLSLEDDLMRIFAGPWVRNFLGNMGMGDGIPITSKMVSRQIEKAQKRVEDRNFEMRKNLLEFDEVNDEQRKEIYRQRQEILEGVELREKIEQMIEIVVGDALESYMSSRVSKDEWDREELVSWANHKFDLKLSAPELEDKGAEAVEELLLERIRQRYESRQQELGQEKMETVERFVLLYTIDNKWKEHLQNLDWLHDSVLHRWVGQKDPKMEYKREAFELFEELLFGVYDGVTDLIFKVGLEERTRQAAASVFGSQSSQHVEFSSFEYQRERALAASHVSDEKPAPFIRQDLRVGRNDPCPCGSGKKYKRCCGRVA